MSMLKLHMETLGFVLSFYCSLILIGLKKEMVHLQRVKYLLQLLQMY